MTPKQLFGEAVHDCLYFIKTKGLRFPIPHDVIWAFLIRGRLSRHIETAPKWLIRRIYAAWNYLGELLTHADAYAIEMSNFRHEGADLILFHRGCVYIIEIKSSLRFIRKATRQIDITLSTLKRKAGAKNFYFIGYCLVFTAVADQPFDAEWHLIPPPP